MRRWIKWKLYASAVGRRILYSSSGEWGALISQQCCWGAVFDLSAWGPNLLKLDCECLVSASGPVCGSRGSAIAAADRRPPANKQMLRGRFGSGRRKSQSQCSNYGGLKITRLQRSVLSQCLCSTHSIPHNKLIRPAQPPWFRMGELMQQHLVPQSHPSHLVQSATLLLCVLLFTWTPWTPLLRFEAVALFFQGDAKHINHAHGG